MENKTENLTVLEKDLREIAQNPILDEFPEGSVILITGAAGLIGSQIARALAYYKRDKKRDLTVVALLRSEQKARQIYGSLIDDGLVTLCIYDVTDELVYDGPVDYIVHCASPTSSRYFVEKPVETIRTALSGTRNILEFSRKKGVKKVVYLSSLEVYGTPDSTKEYISETDYGYIDPMQVRSSYSEGKRMAECMCVSYAGEYQVPVTVARLSQTFGAGVSYDDGRVFAEFARCAIENKNIILHTPGRTVRSYCYTKDAVCALLYLMLRGQAGCAYNVTNKKTAVSIKEMAELVCSLSPQQPISVKIQIPEDVASFGYNPEMVIRLDSSRLEALGWRPTVDLKEMFQRLIQSMQEGRIS